MGMGIIGFNKNNHTEVMGLIIIAFDYKYLQANTRLAVKRE